MIAALLTGFAASSWTRAALRYGAIVLAVLLFLLSLRDRGLDYNDYVSIIFRRINMILMN